MDRNNRHSTKKKFSGIWLYGRHASFAALDNPKRKCLKIVAIEKYSSLIEGKSKNIDVQFLTSPEIAKLLPESAVHQGIAVLVKPLEPIELSKILESEKTIIILDQITDPHNVGAILRSAAAFGAGAIIVAKNNSPEETGTMAKSASGALEVVPLIKATNLSRVMEFLKENGYWCIGLDGSSKTPLHKLDKFNKTALVMGSEGAGLRKLVQSKCDAIVSLPISRIVESLNVSNAAALALYEITIKR